MKHLSSLLILIIAVCLTAAPAYAQNFDRSEHRGKIREFKHNFFKSRLDLSREQAPKFYEEYDRMEDAIIALNDEARAVESKIYDSPDGTVTDLEYEMATKALLEVKTKEAQIENEYYDKFKEILNPRQLFQLRRVEREFNLQLIKYRPHGGKKK